MWHVPCNTPEGCGRNDSERTEISFLTKLGLRSAIPQILPQLPRDCATVSSGPLVLIVRPLGLFTSSTMAPKKYIIAATEPDADVPMSTDFCAEDADVIIRAAGTLDFRAHKAILSFASPSFIDEATFTLLPSKPLPYVIVQESAKTWENILRTIYPMPNPIIDNLDDLLSLFFAAQTHEMKPVANIHKKALENKAFIEEDPLRLFSIACVCGFEDQATYVASNAELLKVTRHPNPGGLEELTLGAYSRLVSFLAERDNEWHRILRHAEIPFHDYCNDCDEQSRARLYDSIKEDLSRPYLQAEEIYLKALEYRSDFQSKCSSKQGPFGHSEIKNFIQKMIKERERVCDRFKPEKWYYTCTTTFRRNSLTDIFFIRFVKEELEKKVQEMCLIC